MNRYLHYYLSCLLLTTFSLQALFTPQYFYRASYLPRGPRLERPLLTTFEARVAGGAAHCSRNSKGKKTPLFAIYDLQPSCCSEGVFDFFETQFYFTQNLTNGFYIDVLVPLRRTYLCRYHVQGCNQELPQQTQHNTPWDRLTQTLNMRLLNESTLGDCVVIAGWTCNYQETTFLDFIDFSIETGVFIPSGRRHRHLQRISYDYTDHCGIPLSGDIAIGLFDWFTFGVHTDALFLIDRSKPVKSINSQKICLPSIATNESLLRLKKGIVSSVSSYLKADHFLGGFSFAFGYTFAHKSKTVFSLNKGFSNITPLSCCDPSLLSWSMHTLHLWAEYDFADVDSWAAPRVSIFYNRIVGGKRIFQTSTVGGYLAVDAAWCF